MLAMLTTERGDTVGIPGGKRVKKLFVLARGFLQFPGEADLDAELRTFQ